MKAHLPEFYLQLCCPYEDLDQLLHSARRLLDNVLLYQICVIESDSLHFDGESVAWIGLPKVVFTVS
jgi:hypothetical protein